MNKKTVFKMIMFTMIGALFGFVISFGLLKINDTENVKILSAMGDFFINNNLVLFVLLLVSLYFPSVYLSIKGRRILNNLENTSDEEYDTQTKQGDKYFDLALTINGIFMILNFMLFGMTFAKLINNETIIVVLFMINIFSSSLLEVATIKFIQKINTRLKGDPTSLKFTKDFLESCDEAEQLTIYKSSYHAFQMTKHITLAFVLLTILCNLLLDTGAFPVFVSCSLLLTHIIANSYYTMSKS